MISISEKWIGEKIHLEHAGEGEVRPGEERRGEGHGRGVAGTRSACFNGWDTGRHRKLASPPWGTLPVFTPSHPFQPQHCWCNASRPQSKVISTKTSNCGTRLKTWLAARSEAGAGDGRPQCEGGRGGREVGKLRGAGSRLGWQASYTAGASSAARAVARGARRCRPCGASTAPSL